MRRIEHIARRAVFALSIFLALVGQASMASADGWRNEEVRPVRLAQSNQYDAREGVRTGRLMPLSQVLQTVRETYNGDYLDVSLDERGSRPLYRIKLLSADGVVTIVTCDAKTGRILKAQRGGRR